MYTLPTPPCSFERRESPTLETAPVICATDVDLQPAVLAAVPQVLKEGTPCPIYIPRGIDREVAVEVIRKNLASPWCLLQSTHRGWGAEPIYLWAWPQEIPEGWQLWGAQPGW